MGLEELMEKVKAIVQSYKEQIVAIVQLVLCMFAVMSAFKPDKNTKKLRKLDAKNTAKQKKLNSKLKLKEMKTKAKAKHKENKLKYKEELKRMKVKYSA